MDKYRKIANQFRYGRNRIRSRKYLGPVVIARDHIFLYVSQAKDGVADMPGLGLAGIAIRYIDKKIIDAPKFDSSDLTMKDIDNMDENGVIKSDKYNLPFLTHYDAIPSEYNHDKEFARLSYGSPVFMLSKEDVDSLSISITGTIDIRAKGTYFKIEPGVIQSTSTKKYLKHFGWL